MSQLAVWNCKQLVTLAGPARPRVRAEMRELAVIPDGAMLVRDGLVEATGTRAEIERRISAGAEIVDAGGRIVLPGFVDAQAAESPEHHVRQATRLEAENQHVLDMLGQTGGDKQEAARMLGVSRATLWRLLKRARHDPAP